MSMWLLQQALTPEDEAGIFARDVLWLPFDGLPDLTHVTGIAEAKKLLAMLYPDEPPEAVTRRVDRFWHCFNDVQIDDIVVVPLTVTQLVAVAEVSGAYRYQVGVDGQDVHLLPVRWYEKKIPLAKLQKHKAQLGGGERMREITDAETRVAIRDRLPHSYNRFAKWKWLLGLMFAMGLVQMLRR